MTAFSLWNFTNSRVREVVQEVPAQCCLPAGIGLNQFRRCLQVCWGGWSWLGWALARGSLQKLGMYKRDARAAWAPLALLREEVLAEQVSPLFRRGVLVLPAGSRLEAFRLKWCRKMKSSRRDQMTSTISLSQLLSLWSVLSEIYYHGSVSWKVIDSACWRIPEAGGSSR